MASKIQRPKTDHEIMMEGLNRLKAEVTKDRESALAFLIDLGILTPKGNLTKRYKHLCIPVEQG